MIDKKLLVEIEERAYEEESICLLFNNEVCRIFIETEAQKFECYIDLGDSLEDFYDNLYAYYNEYDSYEAAEVIIARKAEPTGRICVSMVDLIEDCANIKRKLNELLDIVYNAKKE